MRHFKTKTKVFISLIMCFCMIATILGTNGLSFISTKADETVLNDESLHFMIRHWHSVDSLNEGDNNLVEGIIVPSEDEAYTLYGYDEKSGRTQEMSEEYKTLHHISFDEKKGIVTIGFEPAKDESGKEIEEFSGITASAGHEAVTTSEENVIIHYPTHSDIHVAKVHIYYIKTIEAEGKQLGEANLEQDTKIEDGVTYYNTDSGLHTNKTATISEMANDGRTYDLTLESWFAGDNVFDVGMVLDASGSMAFTSDEPKPIILDEKELSALGIKDAENEKLEADTVNQILDRNYTDNSSMSYSDYTYFVYDFRDNTQEYAPLGYWGGEYKKSNGYRRYTCFGQFAWILFI